MQRLIEKGLMFGNLFHVGSPALVDRYSRALEHLTGRTTDLDDFHIDISGYSPEIGDELEDHDYLNHGGVNRQFILLATEQKRCPLLNARFSTSRHILRRFIDANEHQLFALTATDAIAGELENSVFSVDTIEQLFDIRRIVVEADTTSGTIAHADHLARLVERFQSEQDAWFDNDLIGEMIDTARRTGDVTRNPVHLEHEVFEQRSYWTSLFGGLYLFQDVESSGLIACGDRPSQSLPVARVMAVSNRRAVAEFLRDNDLAEPIVKVRGAEEVAILRQKQDFILASVLAEQAIDITGCSRAELRRLATRHGITLPAEYEGLAAVLRWAESGAARPKIRLDHPAYFYTLRATDTPSRDLVNMLLAELTPMDILQLYICHKDEFYRRYRSWPQAARNYAADFLEREYVMNKAASRAALFGGDEE